MTVVHFHNGSGGGVLSVIRSLIAFSTHRNVGHHIIFTIDKRNQPYFEVPKIKGVQTSQVFSYSPSWNFYYTCQKLSNLLPDKNAVIVAHDWLELGMVSNLGLKNPVVYFAHGDYDYYYDLALLHEPIIDSFVGVAKNIEQKLKVLLPHRLVDIHYLRMPVPDWNGIRKKDEKGLNLVFLGRLSKGKGFDRLYPIAEELRKKDVAASWHFIGENIEGMWNPQEWEDVDATYHGQLNRDEIYQLLSNMDFLILPTLAEGMPLSVVECMKAGVVPIVNDIEGGIRELVINNQTGFRIQGNSYELFVEHIIQLHTDFNLKEKISVNAQMKANQLFDPISNTLAIENLFEKVSATNHHKIAKKVYGSFLDKKWIPNWLTTSVRKLKA